MIWMNHIGLTLLRMKYAAILTPDLPMRNWPRQQVTMLKKLSNFSWDFTSGLKFISASRLSLTQKEMAPTRTRIAPYDMSGSSCLQVKQQKKAAITIMSRKVPQMGKTQTAMLSDSSLSMIPPKMKKVEATTMVHTIMNSILWVIVSAKLNPLVAQSEATSRKAITQRTCPMRKEAAPAANQRVGEELFGSWSRPLMRRRMSPIDPKRRPINIFRTDE